MRECLRNLKLFSNFNPLCLSKILLVASFFLFLYEVNAYFCYLMRKLNVQHILSLKREKKYIRDF